MLLLTHVYASARMVSRTDTYTTKFGNFCVKILHSSWIEYLIFQWINSWKKRKHSHKEEKHCIMDVAIRIGIAREIWAQNSKYEAYLIPFSSFYEDNVQEPTFIGTTNNFLWTMPVMIYRRGKTTTVNNNGVTLFRIPYVRYQPLYHYYKAGS